MATPLTDVYGVFLAKVTADQWILPEEVEIAKADWRQFLDTAIFRFRYPKVSLEIDEEEESFVNTLTGEIQVLAVYMKHEWIKRCVADWSNIRSIYVDTEFSPANHLQKLEDLSLQVNMEAKNFYDTYSRVENGKPTAFGKLAGKNQ